MAAIEAGHRLQARQALDPAAGQRDGNDASGTGLFAMTALPVLDILSAVRASVCARPHAAPTPVQRGSVDGRAMRTRTS